MNGSTTSTDNPLNLIDELEHRVLSGGSISFDEALSLATIPDTSLPALAAAADRIRGMVCGDRIGFCAIVSARTGGCSENCAFCAQSGDADARMSFSPMMFAEDILEHAQRVEPTGAHRFGIVTSGRTLSERDFETTLRAIRLIRENTSLVPCASLGFITPERAARLVEAGLSRYHHNLETSRSFFGDICTTHTYDERVNTVRTAQEAGLEVCCGGLFNLGESWDQRVELAFALRELDPVSVPVNFLDPRPGTALQGRLLMNENDATRVIAIFRFILPKTFIRLAGGRKQTFSRDPEAALKCGANSLLIGDLLTTSGPDAASETALAQSLGFEPDPSC
jgi:biotin synthase